MSGGWSARGGQTQSAYLRGGVVDDGIFGHSMCDQHLVSRRTSNLYRIHLDRPLALQWP